MRTMETKLTKDTKVLTNFKKGKSDENKFAVHKVRELNSKKSVYVIEQKRQGAFLSIVFQTKREVKLAIKYL